MAITCPVSHLQPLTDTVMQVVLQVPAEQRFLYQAGQYLEVALPSGSAPFSIANAPLGSREIELHIRHTKDNPIAQAIMTQVFQQQALQIAGPEGHSIYQPTDLTTIFLAAGTGFAPMKAMIEQALANGDTQPMHLFWGARTTSDLYLHSLAESWQVSIPHFKYTPVLSKPAAEWAGQTGVIYQVVTQIYPDLSQQQLYAAGPFEMVQAAWRHFKQKNLLAQHMHADAL